MTLNDSRIPGISFKLINTHVSKPDLSKGYVAKVHLSAHFDDLEMWDQVRENLQEFRLAEGDVKTEIIDLLQEDKRTLQSLLQDLEKDTGATVDSLRKQLAESMRDKNLAMVELVKLQREVEAMRAACDELNELKEMMQHIIEAPGPNSE